MIYSILGNSVPARATLASSGGTPLVLLLGFLLAAVLPGIGAPALPAVLPAVATGPGVNGSGTLASEARQLPAFEALQLDLVAAVTVTRGEKVTFTVKSDDNILPLILTETSGTTLRIHAKQHFLAVRPVVISITLPVLKSATINGSGTITIAAVTKTALVAVITGTGTLTAKGQVGTLTAAINGSGNLRAAELETTTTEITLAGTSNATVRATDRLKAVVYGTGTVTYAGQPKKVEKSIFGPGAVKPE